MNKYKHANEQDGKFASFNKYTQDALQIDLSAQKVKINIVGALKGFTWI